MRNKEQLNQDFESVATPAIKEEVDIVQMCAHDVRHTGLNFVEMQPVHTKDNKKVRFHFEPITRKGTDDEVEGLVGDAEVNDIKYTHMEVL